MKITYKFTKYCFAKSNGWGWVHNCLGGDNSSLFVRYGTDETFFYKITAGEPKWIEVKSFQISLNTPKHFQNGILEGNFSIEIEL